MKNYLKELDELENRIFFSDLEKFKAIADPLKQAAYDEIVKFVQVSHSEPISLVVSVLILLVFPFTFYRNFTPPLYLLNANFLSVG